MARAVKHAARLYHAVGLKVCVCVCLQCGFLGIGILMRSQDVVQGDSSEEKWSSSSSAVARGRTDKESEDEEEEEN